MARLANSLALAGEINNTRGGVEMILEGAESSLQQFVTQFPSASPKNAVIESIDRDEIPTSSRIGIEIRAGDCAGAIQTTPPLDVMVCPDCLCDINATGNRRFRYPFTSCAHCGPRYSILETLPYQRTATAMVGFPLCAVCQEEFASPDDRRFHAETIACPDCGPTCTFARADGKRCENSHDPVEAARAALLRGEIVALRGLGGYQLLVDATNSEAVKRLRGRKQRRGKPLAVLLHSLEAAKADFSICAAAEAALTSAAGAIVLTQPISQIRFAPEIAPGLGEIGVMLATTPLHYLVADGMPPLVATSGNCEGEPIAFERENAKLGLTKIADGFLEHDRPIRRPIDDSVVRIIASKPVTLRLARGLAPLSLHVEPWSQFLGETQILALGGQQNNAIAIWNGSQAVLGPHVGDLDNLATCERWHEHRRDLCGLFGATPEFVAHDLHPDYYSSRWVSDSKLSPIAIQHHHAHIVSGMLEHHWLDREVLGVAWDGTGLGTDGQFWGGEFLKATATSFARIARLRPFALPGGETAIRQPWRVALSLLSEALGKRRAVEFLIKRGYDSNEINRVCHLLERPHLMPQTSSVGRLFDAVAVLACPMAQLGNGVAQYEGHFAMLLESICPGPDDAYALPGYAMPLRDAEVPELDWRPIISAIVDDKERGVSASLISQQFHVALAQSIVTLSNLHADLPVVLGGGVFQNRILTEMVQRLLQPTRREMGRPGTIPPGDGGLAAGQLAIAMARLATKKRSNQRTQKAFSSCA